MITFFRDFFEQIQGTFSSQDSKYFILTAIKFTLVPIISFLIVFYSIWTIMEINFNFFVANGFSQPSDVFYDQIFMNINDYMIYFGTMAIIVFLFGLFISFLALRPFDHIEDHIYLLREDIDQNLEVSWMNKNKLIYQVSRLFFRYIQLYVKNEKRPQFRLPYQIESLTKPPIDKVFLFQYCSVVGIICLSTSMLLFSFTNEVYSEIVASGLELLPSNKIVAIFLDEQKKIFVNMYSISTILSVFTYVLISRNIIKTVDGVSFGFSRDMISIIKGQHSIRFNARDGEPGQEITLVLNQILDDVFSDSEEHKTLKDVVDKTLNQMEEEYTPKFDKEDELIQPEEVHSEKDYSESKVINMLFRGEVIEAEEISEDSMPPVWNNKKIP